MCRKLVIAAMVALCGSPTARVLAASERAYPSAIMINVANAPGWQAGRTYVAGDRVLAGPGRIAGSPGSFTSGQPLYLWALSAGAGGTSTASGNGPQSCPNPAKHGGGLNGTVPSQWSRATTASDGALTWTCLAVIDYATLSGMLNDGPIWQANTNYYFGQYIESNGNEYRNVTKTSYTHNLPYYCTSGPAAPSGSQGATTYGWTTDAAAAADGLARNACTWLYQAPIIYSSRHNIWPHELFSNGIGTGAVMQLTKPVIITTWYGGAKQRLYQAGANGEVFPIMLWWHGDTSSDTGSESGASCISGGNAQTSWCPGFPIYYYNWTVAPGDSFQDNIQPAAGPLYPNSAVGVMVYSNESGGNQEAISIDDFHGHFQRLQFKSENGAAVTGHAHGAVVEARANNETFLNDLFYAGGGYGAVSCDGGCFFGNDVIYYGGSATGGYGISLAYTGGIHNSTLIGPGPGCATCTAIEQQDAHDYGGLHNYAGVATINFVNPFAYGTNGGTTGIPTQIYNATDVSSSYASTSFTQADVDVAYTTSQLGGVGSTCRNGLGSCYGLAPSAMIVNAASDWRTGVSSPLYGAGGACRGCLATDILGSKRPMLGRYDIGAYQHVP